MYMTGVNLESEIDVYKRQTINAPFHSQELFIEEIFKGMKDGQLFIAGKIEEEHILKAKDYKINIIDYFNREEMQMCIRDRL